MAVLPLNKPQSDSLSEITSTNFENALRYGVNNSVGSTVVSAMLSYGDFDATIKNLIQSSYLSLAAALMKVESWTDVSVFTGTWTAYGNVSYFDPAYGYNAFGDVQLRGLAAPGGATAPSEIFTLPTGYRPSKALIFPVAVTPVGAAMAQVSANGKVYYLEGPAGVTWVSLSGISFKAAPNP